MFSWLDGNISIASILPFFQGVLSFTVLVLLVIIYRLYQGIRILNARLDILSTLVKSLRKEVLLTAGIEEMAYEEFDAVDLKLQNKLKGDFSMRQNPSVELETQFRGRDLMRSSVNLQATDDTISSKQPTTSGAKPNPTDVPTPDAEAKEAEFPISVAESQKGSHAEQSLQPPLSTPVPPTTLRKRTPVPASRQMELERYDANESGFQVEMKSDLSYIAKPYAGHVEPVVFVSLPGAEEKTEKETEAESEAEAKANSPKDS